MDLGLFRKTIIDLSISNVYVGFSGGADSTALLILLNKECIDLNVKLLAVHYNHGLRGEESDDDARWCREFCESRDIDIEIDTFSVMKEKNVDEGIEAAARRLRLEKWSDKVEKCSNKAIVALGHHADDRIENVLLRMSRGSNVTGLTSIRYLQRLGNTLFIRPLVNFDRNAIITFLNSQNIEWREDSSNKNVTYKRNFIRNSVLPLIYDEIDYAKTGIVHSINSLEKDAEYIENEAQKQFNICVVENILSVTEYIKLHSAIKIRVLRIWLSEALGNEFIPDRKLFKRLETEIERSREKSGEKILIPLRGGEPFLKLQQGCLSVYEKSNSIPEDKQWNWLQEEGIIWNDLKVRVTIHDSERFLADDDNIAYFDADQLPVKLKLKTFSPGDRMIPFGHQNEVKLKKIFSDRKILSEQKEHFPSLCTDNEIIWVLGVRRSNLYLVTENTKRIAVFEKYD